MVSFSVGDLVRLGERPIDVLMRPVRAFAQHNVAGALVLLVAGGAALVVANSALGEEYHRLLETEASLALGPFLLEKTLHHWVNDAVMGLFFFLVGLEIKREILLGGLRGVRSALLPAFAALGGMVVPAVVYLVVAPANLTHGWGVPVATDIAFALGVLALVGKRAPSSLRLFLLALAIVDDIGAVIVIAIFYTADVSISALLVGACLYAVSIVANLLHVRSAVLYFLLGAGVWLAFSESGVHATTAAVLMAFTIPARTSVDGELVLRKLARLISQLRAAGLPPADLSTPSQQALVDEMESVLDRASSPLHKIEEGLSHVVAFVVLPLFAFTNAGVELPDRPGAALGEPVLLAVVLGLCVGKPLGVTVFTWVAIKARLCAMPVGMTWRHVIGAGLLAGIGFTMALFISQLAFGGGEDLDSAKLAIIIASAFTGVAGWAWLRFLAPGVDR